MNGNGNSGVGFLGFVWLNMSLEEIREEGKDREDGEGRE